MRGDVLNKELFDFDLQNSKNTLPIWTSAQFGIWKTDIGVPYALADVDDYRKAYFSKIQNSIKSKRSIFYQLNYDAQHLPIDYPRIAVGWKGRATDSRTTIAALIPPGIATTDASSIFIKRKGSPKSEAFLLGVICSIPFDWLIRKWVEMNLTFELLEPAPIPKFSEKDDKTRRLCELSARLASTDSRYSDWAKDNDVSFGTLRETEAADSAIFEIDALVALLYGLNIDDLKFIFESFHRGWNHESRFLQTVEFFKKWDQ
jgi:hypothetical protein